MRGFCHSNMLLFLATCPVALSSLISTPRFCDALTRTPTVMSQFNLDKVTGKNRITAQLRDLEKWRVVELMRSNTGGYIHFDEATTKCNHFSLGA